MSRPRGRGRPSGSGPTALVAVVAPLPCGWNVPPQEAGDLTFADPHVVVDRFTGAPEGTGEVEARSNTVVPLT